ncbi:hypothetical protein K438DRAFT_1873600 [Mycena galopus ATCC 62051]|nr:hypothetical protein K438DRAFT_1873600 [Mycena galopus ATCC 62051]
MLHPLVPPIVIKVPPMARGVLARRAHGRIPASCGRAYTAAPPRGSRTQPRGSPPGRVATRTLSRAPKGVNFARRSASSMPSGMLPTKRTWPGGVTEPAAWSSRGARAAEGLEGHVAKATEGMTARK